MGDTFDSRKGVDFVSLEWAKNHYYDKLEELGITVHTIIGNHTAYYKNTNDLTGVGLFLREYDNVKIYPRKILKSNHEIILSFFSHQSVGL